MPSVQKFWFGKLRSFSLHDNAHDGFPSYFFTSQLHSEYLDFCKDLGERHPVTDRTFTKELKRMCPGIAKGRKITDKGTRGWVLYVPDLLEARANFQAFIGKAPVDWDDDMEDGFMIRDGPFDNKINGMSYQSH
jgi:hypothetical protein